MEDENIFMWIFLGVLTVLWNTLWVSIMFSGFIQGGWSGSFISVVSFVQIFMWNTVMLWGVMEVFFD